MKILLFEEDSAVRNLLLRFLAREGHEVTAYSSASEAYDVVLTDHCPSAISCFDVLLTDLRMAGMTGLEFIECCLKHGCGIPTENMAVLSGGWTLEYYTHAERLGCQTFSKPFHLEALRGWLGSRPVTRLPQNKKV